MKNDRNVTLRRMIQQVKHCAEEALSVVERDEDMRCAMDDLKQAEMLIRECIEDAAALQKIKDR